MGTFLGHLIPGVFFGIFSLRWLWAIFNRYFKSQRKSSLTYHASKFQNSSMYHSKFCGKRFPVEGISIIIATLLGFIGEFYTGFKNGKFVHLMNAQHMSMYFFFAICGVVNVLQFFKFTLLPDLDYITSILAFGIEAFLFFHHLNLRTPMDIQVHMFLVYAIVGCILSLSLEMKYRDNVMAGLARTFFTMLQATWFVQIGFILHPPSATNTWTEDSHNQMMIVTLIFTWHIAAIFIFMCIVGACFHCRVKSMNCKEKVVYHSLDQRFPILMSTTNENDNVDEIGNFD